MQQDIYLAALEWKSKVDNGYSRPFSAYAHRIISKSKVDNYLNEFKKIIFKKSNHKEVKNLAKLLLNRIL